LSLNPQKLAGQCAKLKCCMNFEVDQYVEASRLLPSREVQLETVDGTYYYFKADILSNLITYSTDRRMAANLETITAARALQVIAMNKEGRKPESLSDQAPKVETKPLDLATQDDLTRFDTARRKKKKKKH
jgi:cell fate regulator YaaT (PSP1 superfamily)